MTPAPQKPATLEAKIKRFVGSLSIRSRVIGAVAGVLLVTLVAGGVAAATRPDGGLLADTSAASAPASATPSSSSSIAKATATATPVAAFTEESPADPTSVTAASDAATVAITDTSATNTLAVTLLATLAVKGKAPKTGYDRVGDFGTAWLDVDRNGCDTRNDVLGRDLTSVVKSGTCKVMSGTIVSPYTNATISFVRGAATSALVQIDHVVPLANAWQTGAQQLSQAQRVSLANDPLNLLAVDGRSNEQKSDGDTATWLPANKAYRCHYVARQISVKATYGLWVTQAERDAMTRILDTCPTEPALTSGFAPAPAPVVVAPVPAAPAPAAPAPEPAPAAPAWLRHGSV
ncbi:HNH endonuclease family protein, partial [Cryobacterium sp. RTS3]|uniref:HNH endonuclease family protein n=1 Tax=Cryobacterium sp. RTS3 TaxID=3048643 RepID=UPI002B238C66